MPPTPAHLKTGFLCKFLAVQGMHSMGQADLELGDSSASSSRTAIKGVYHHSLVNTHFQILTSNRTTKLMQFIWDVRASPEPDLQRHMWGKLPFLMHLTLLPVPLSQRGPFIIFISTSTLHWASPITAAPNRLEARHWAKPHKATRKVLLPLLHKWTTWISEELSNKEGRRNERQSPGLSLLPLSGAGRHL